MNTSFSLFESRPELAAAIADNQLALGSTAALGAAGLVWYLLTTDNSQIKKLRGWPLIGQWLFFTKRHDFVLDGFRQLPRESMFGFNILHHNVIAVRGEEARKTFFDKRELSFTEGYRILFGGAPDAKDATSEVAEKNDQEQYTSFVRRLTPLLRMDRLAALTPQFMSDLDRTMSTWGPSGRFDPFEDIYSLVFQLTIRATACREVADSVPACKKMEKLYWLVEKGSTPSSVLMPWLPSSARKMRKEATTEIYTWFDEIIKARKEEDRTEDDALQVLMDLGDSTADIIQFTLGTLFAGIINSGLMSAWIMIFLDQTPEWKQRVVDELKSLLDTHAPVSSGRTYASVADRFSQIGPEVWENEMPVLEACLRETIRLIFSGAMLRRIVKDDVDLDGKTIPRGSFLVYLASETHHNPDIYPDPAKFDPGRYAAGQDKSEHHAFLGWGVGRHPCLGKRFAQYEIKAICAMFFSQYEYQVVDSKGVRPDPTTTVPDRNNLYQQSPKDEVYYVKYTKRAVEL